MHNDDLNKGLVVFGEQSASPNTQSSITGTTGTSVSALQSAFGGVVAFGLSEEPAVVEDIKPKEETQEIENSVDVSYTDLIYDTEDSRYNENKYRSDNIIRDYEEDNKYEYPLIYLVCNSIEEFKVKALQGMIEKRTFIEDADTLYHTYVEVNDAIVYIGRMERKKLRVLLDNPIFSDFNKRVYLDEDTKYEGDLLYALV